MKRNVACSLDQIPAPEVASPVIVGEIEPRRIDQLILYANNARIHSDAQIEQIAQSIREFGFVNPILVGIDHTIIAGHARLLAARKLGMSTVPVIVLAHLSEVQRRALMIADNQLALNAAWDDEMLRAELAALQQEEFDLELLGFDDNELARLLASTDIGEGLTDPDAVPALAQTPVTVTGDLWLLGNHRLLCGDATRREASGIGEAHLLRSGTRSKVRRCDRHQVAILNRAEGDARRRWPHI